LKIALIGAGSRSFGPGTIRDIMLSDPLTARRPEIVLMDIVPKHLKDIAGYARAVAQKLGRKASIRTTTSLDAALKGADFVVAAIEVDRYLYWSMDFHVPRRYGFAQVYGENGGPGGMFHALRNMGPTVNIARRMEKLCPRAPLLNFTNPETKLIEAVSRLTDIRAYGLCHGVGMGMAWVSAMLGRPVESMEMVACGMNHFTWFQSIRDRKTGKDLYPLLREVDAKSDPLTEWHELALARILFRRFGLWPSPAPNHFGEYLSWAEEFVTHQVQYYYDPMDGSPWKTGRVPEFVYSLSYTGLKRHMGPGKEKKAGSWENEMAKARKGRIRVEKVIRHSGEVASYIMEGLACGERRKIDAVNLPNLGSIPNLPDDMVVEVPAEVDSRGLKACQMEPLPEGAAGLLRPYAAIHKLLVEAFAEHSKNKLVQAVLLDPTCRSYRGAVDMVDEMIRLQKGILPPLK